MVEPLLMTPKPPIIVVDGDGVAVFKDVVSVIRTIEVDLMDA